MHKQIYCDALCPSGRFAQPVAVSAGQIQRGGKSC
jgi:hypothetical protein